MRVLVTGHLGFIGRHLTAAILDAGHSLVGIDVAGRPSGDIRYESAFESLCLGKFDACVHLAAIAAPDKCKADPTVGFETNVRGTLNILNYCVRGGIKRIVFISSSHVYGIDHKYRPADENHPLALGDLYTTSKILGESLVELFWKNHGLSYAALRLFNCYGPGQSNLYFLGRKLEQAIAGGPVTIRNAHVAKDWIWIDDAVCAIMLALESDYVGPLNVGTGVETELEYVARRVADGFGVQVLTEPGFFEGKDRMCANVDRLRALGWEPRVTLDEGLAVLIKASKPER